MSNINDAVEAAALFRLTRDEALKHLSKINAALRGWKKLAASKAVAMSPAEIRAFEPAFVHAQGKRAQEIAG